MEIWIELITFIVLVIIVLVIFCFICVVIRRSSGEQNLVHPDEIELRPLEQPRIANEGVHYQNRVPMPLVRVNEVISHANVQMSVRLGERVEDLELAQPLQPKRRSGRINADDVPIAAGTNTRMYIIRREVFLFLNTKYLGSLNYHKQLY